MKIIMSLVISALLFMLVDFASGQQGQEQGQGCYRPTQNTTWDDDIYLPANFEVSFTWTPEEDICAYVREQLGGTCRSLDHATYGSGFILNAPDNSYLQWQGYTFDDNSGAAGRLTIVNACILALYGNQPTRNFNSLPTSDSAFSVNSAIQAPHWYGNCDAGNCSQCTSSSQLNTGFDWSSSTFATGNSCTGDDDTDGATDSLTCYFGTAEFTPPGIWREIFRITDNPGSNYGSVADGLGRRVAVFSEFQNRRVLHIILANPGSDNQRCNTDPITGTSTEVFIRVMGTSVELLLDNKPASTNCLSELSTLVEAPLAVESAQLRTSGFYDAAPGEFCIAYIWHATCWDNRIFTWEESYMGDCCDIESCPIGGGNCESDAQCSGNLICGSDNCHALFPNNVQDTGLDCCIDACSDVSHPNWHFDPSCCRNEFGKQCSWGNGACVSDAECQEGLACGASNCVEMHSQGGGFASDSNCCTGQCAVPTSAGWTYDSACCSVTRPCTYGQGGCESDADCAGELSCGTNNCAEMNPLASFPQDANCCTDNCAVSSSASWTYDSACCTDSRPCTSGQGGCTTDSQCAGDLSCGTNNCLEMHPDRDFLTEADCCTDQCAVFSADGWTFDADCCTPSRQCTTGQGGCSVDEDCAGELYCGTSNCRNLNPTVVGFTTDANCCTGRCRLPAFKGWEFDVFCCTRDRPCSVGQGGCTFDDECIDGSTCGYDNCAALNSGLDVNFPSDARCCEVALPTPTNMPTSSPTPVPTDVPTPEPTPTQTEAPSLAPTQLPTSTPTLLPTDIPSPLPTSVPTHEPSPSPTEAPTPVPTPGPTASTCDSVKEDTYGGPSVVAALTSLSFFHECCDLCLNDAECQWFSFRSSNTTQQSQCHFYDSPFDTIDREIGLAAGWTSATAAPVIDEETVSSTEPAGFVAKLMDNIVLLVMLAAMSVIVAYLTRVSRRKDAVARREMKNQVRRNAENAENSDDRRRVPPRAPVNLDSQLEQIDKLRSSHANIALIALAFVDFAVDCAFVARRFELDGTDELGRVSTFPLLTAIFLASSMTINLIYTINFLRREFKTQEMRDWFKRNSIFGSVCVLLSVANPEVLTLFTSHTFGCLERGTMFHAPFTTKAERKLHYAGLIANFCEDMPQIGFQLWVMVALEGSTVLTVIAFITSVLTLSFGLIRRFLLKTIGSQQKLADVATEAGAAARAESIVMQQQQQQQQYASNAELARLPGTGGAMPGMHSRSPYSVASSQSDIPGAAHAREHSRMPMPLVNAGMPMPVRSHTASDHSHVPMQPMNATMSMPMRAYTVMRPATPESQDVHSRASLFPVTPTRSLLHKAGSDNHEKYVREAHLQQQAQAYALLRSHEQKLNAPGASVEMHHHTIFNAGTFVQPTHTAEGQLAVGVDGSRSNEMRAVQPSRSVESKESPRKESDADKADVVESNERLSKDADADADADEPGVMESKESVSNNASVDEHNVAEENEGPSKDASVDEPSVVERKKSLYEEVNDQGDIL